MTEVVAESVQFLEPRSANQGDRGGSPGYSGGGQRDQGNPYSQNQNQQRNNNNNNYTRVDEDPFANDGQPIDISDDDLPF